MDDWRTYLAIPESVKIGVQIGDVRPFGELHGHGDDAWAFTMGNPENTEFEVCIDPRALERDDLLQIVVHELVHVWSFSQVGDDPRENMEAVTDELARIVRERRDIESRSFDAAWLRAGFVYDAANPSLNLAEAKRIAEHFWKARL